MTAARNREEDVDVPVVVADISVSVDGVVTGPDPGLEHGLGVGGEPLHEWARAGAAEVDREILDGPLPPRER